MFAVLADDQDLVREAIATVLSHLFQFKVLEAKNASEAVHLTQTHNPVLVILDLMMPGEDSFTAAAKIRQMAPHTKVVILTGRAEVDLLLRARELKLHGFVLKGGGVGGAVNELTYAIKTVLSGGIYIAPSLSEHLLDPARTQNSLINMLTPKERTVLTLLAQGLTMKMAATRMDISVKTAETHRNNLGRKLGHPNRAQMFAFAMRHRLVDDQVLTISA